VKTRLLVEAKFLAQVQATQAMLDGGDPTAGIGNHLHGDGTSTFHKHYKGFQVTTSAGNTFTLGLHEMGGSRLDENV
jgi:hypothetical protein